MKQEWHVVTRIAFVAMAFFSCTEAHAGNITLGIGADYSSGKYGEPNTTKELFVPFSVGYKEGAWRAKLVIPFISISGNGEVFGGGQDRVVDDRRGRNSGSGSSGSGGGGSNSGSGGGGQDDSQEAAEDSSPTAANSSSRESGLGDISLSATYAAISNETSGIYLDVTARVKFGTASADKGLGSGENDYGVHIDLDKDIDKATLSIGAGYTIIGDPDGFNYRNVISADTGVTYRFSDVLSANIFLNYRQSVRSSAPDQFDVTPGIGIRINEHQRVNTYLLFGLQDGSPDFGAGIAYAYTF